MTDGGTCKHAIQIGQVCSLCVNLPEFAPDMCQWIRDEWGDEYVTTCGEGFCLDEGTLSENNIRYCCYCGCPIDEIIARDVEE